ncbi:hypothetical protein [Consotaella aegiceratis]
MATIRERIATMVDDTLTIAGEVRRRERQMRPEARREAVRRS